MAECFVALDPGVMTRTVPAVRLLLNELCRHVGANWQCP